MTTATDTTEPTAAELWCVHVLGPDDVLACRDREAAVRNAMHINLATYPTLIADGATRYAPMPWAVPAVWPHSPEGHAANLAERDAEDPRWSGPNDALAPLAAEVFGAAAGGAA